MSEEFFLIIYLFIIIGSQFCGGNKSNIQEQLCIENYNSSAYTCENIKNYFPSINYFIFRHLTCNSNCKFPTFSNQTFPFQENELISVNLSKTSINTIKPHAFVNLHHLQFLDLSYNEISNISKHSFDSLRKLSELSLQHSQINVLQPGFLDSSQMEQVNISFNNLQEVLPETFNGSDLLIHLDFQHNKINKLHYRSFMHLATLEYLDLSYNSICHLPIGVFNWLNNLRELNLGHNRFSKFELGTFSGLRMLETLNLSHNKFRIIDASSLMTLDRLRHLDISSNAIFETSLIEIFEDIQKLTSISIDNNIISCDKLKTFMVLAKRFKISIANTAEQFQIRNINGVACSITKPSLKDNFETFLRKVERESNNLEKQECNSM